MTICLRGLARLLVVMLLTGLPLAQAQDTELKAPPAIEGKVLATQYMTPAASVSKKAIDQTEAVRFMIPAGTPLTVALNTDLDSENTLAGDKIEATLKTPLLSPTGYVVIPEGSRLRAKVQDVTHAKMPHLQARMLLDFYQAVTPDGVVVPISAMIDSDDGYLAGNHHSRRLQTMAVNTAIKETVALTAGPIAGYGTGAALFVLGSKGKDVVFKPGDELPLRLSRDVHFDPSALYHEMAIPKEAAVNSGYNFLNIAPEEVPLQLPRVISSNP